MNLKRQTNRPSLNFRLTPTAAGGAVFLKASKPLPNKETVRPADFFILVMVVLLKKEGKKMMKKEKKKCHASKKNAKNYNEKAKAGRDNIPGSPPPRKEEEEEE
mmetsp:Transcript_50122/g.99041  ORF Transcript_50122/g.99041 Transcript_50122/m.99041 type:complete len:104 (+) Transcript_50122:434-745(+)